jgi:hypothetical protein
MNVAFSSLSDSKGNTYVLVGSERDSNPVRGRLYYCENGTGGSGHYVTLTIASSEYKSILFVEVTGGASGILDKNAGAGDATSPFSSGATATTTQATELLLGFSGDSSTVTPTLTYTPSSATPSTGWTQVSGATITDNQNYWCGATYSNSVSATGDYTWSYTVSGGNGSSVHLVTLKQGSGVTFTPHMGLLGVG